MTDTIIVGAGMSGLVAARRLVDAGQQVVVLDKGRGPGGRMATRRAAGVRGVAVMDHGAQFFTVRSDEMAAMVLGWPVHVWHHGPATARSVEDDPGSAVAGGDGHPRYVGDEGMNGIAKHLARGLDVRRGVRVQSVAPVDGGWQVETGHGSALSAPRVLLTPPVPQAVALLPEGLVGADVAGLSYEPCVALLAATDVPPAMTAVQFDEGPVRFIADNGSKGISPAPSVTVHAHGGWSADHYDEAEHDLVDHLWELARPWLSPVRAGEPQLKRWRYATPVRSHEERAVTPADGLVLAGDAFGGAKVEGAVLSGLAAAALLI